MKEHFNFLKEKINECIATRINIRDVHGSDMEAIAKRLDDNKQHANIAKAAGLFCSIGGEVKPGHVAHKIFHFQCGFSHENILTITITIF